MNLHLSDVFRGFLFGMTLQLAIGPVCLFIFTTAAKTGFIAAEAGVAAVIIIDALFIILALAGISRFLSGSRLKKSVNLLGAAIVALFGVKLIADTITTLPADSVAPSFSATAAGSFLAALLLTASNPLTIVFWTGVFGARVTRHDSDGNTRFYFATGCLGATPAFLTAVAVAGSTLRDTLPMRFVPALNAAAGTLFILYSIKRVIAGRTDTV